MAKRKSPQLIGDRTSRLISALRHGANAVTSGLLGSLYLSETYKDEREGHLDSARHFAAELLDYLALRGGDESPADCIDRELRFPSSGYLAPYRAAALEVLADVARPRAARDVAPGSSWAFRENPSQAQIIAAERAGAR